MGNVKNTELIYTNNIISRPKTTRETYDDRRMRIDELYEETRYKYNPQYNIEYIREITVELKRTEVFVISK